MTNLLGRVTLYDMLSVLIPGNLFLICVNDLLECVCSIAIIQNNNISELFMIFALSYILGLLLHYFSKLVFNRILRNIKEHIEKEYNRFNKDVDKRRENPIDLLYYRYYYAQLGQVSVVPILEVQVSFLRSMFFVFLLGFVVCLFKDKMTLLPFDNLIASMFLLLIMAIDFFLMAHIQKKIYYHIFEDYYYINCDEKN